MTTTSVLTDDGDARFPGSETVVLQNRPLRADTDVTALSRFGDECWNLTPALLAPHARSTSLNFGSVHPDFVFALKHLYWAMINHDGDDATVNRHHRGGTPAMLTISTMFRFTRAFTDWLASRGCQ